MTRSGDQAFADGSVRDTLRPTDAEEATGTLADVTPTTSTPEEPMTAAVPEIVNPVQPEQGTTIPESAQEESTVGTGTAMALGCIAATGVLIVIALIYLAINAFL